MGLRRAFTDLRAFLRRYTVAELLVAFLLAGATIAFVNAIVLDLIWTPIVEPASESGSFGGYGFLSFVIGGRVFQTEQLITSGVTLGLLVVAAAFVARWQIDHEGTFAKCPHCLSEIPAEARVCASCTREVGEVPEPQG